MVGEQLDHFILAQQPGNISDTLEIPSSHQTPPGHVLVGSGHKRTREQSLDTSGVQSPGTEPGDVLKKVNI